jgi:hypothetical protein
MISVNLTLRPRLTQDPLGWLGFQAAVGVEWLLPVKAWEFVDLGVEEGVSMHVRIGRLTGRTDWISIAVETGVNTHA